jgi:hypothetical protein
MGFCKSGDAWAKGAFLFGEGSLSDKRVIWGNKARGIFENRVGTEKGKNLLHIVRVISNMEVIIGFIATL